MHWKCWFSLCFLCFFQVLVFKVWVFIMSFLFSWIWVFKVFVVLRFSFVFSESGSSKYWFSVGFLMFFWVWAFKVLVLLRFSLVVLRLGFQSIGFALVFLCFLTKTLQRLKTLSVHILRKTKENLSKTSTLKAQTQKNQRKPKQNQYFESPDAEQLKKT